MQQIYHKRGDTFHAVATWRNSLGNPVDLTSYTINSQIRGTNFLQNVTVVKVDSPNGVFSCSVSGSNMQSFPVTDSRASQLFWDIEFVLGDVVVSTETVQIVVVEDITR